MQYAAGLSAAYCIALRIGHSACCAGGNGSAAANRLACGEVPVKQKRDRIESLFCPHPRSSPAHRRLGVHAQGGKWMDDGSLCERLDTA